MAAPPPLNELKVNLQKTSTALVLLTSRLADRIDIHQASALPPGISVKDERLRNRLLDCDVTIAAVNRKLQGVLESLQRFQVTIGNGAVANGESGAHATRPDMNQSDQMMNGSLSGSLNEATVVGDLIDVDETIGSAGNYATHPPQMLNGFAHAATVENDTGGSVTARHQLNPNQIERDSHVVGDVFDAQLAWVESPSLFWLHKIPQEHSLTWTKQEIFGTLKVPTVCQPNIGKYCLAPYCDLSSSTEAHYYRGRIMEMTKLEDDDYAKILYIDFGNSDLVSVELLKELPLRYVGIKWQVIPCLLANVEPLNGVSWNCRADSHNLSSLLHSASGEPLNLRVKAVAQPANTDGILPVELSIVVSETPGSRETQLDNINRSFVEKGYGRRTSGSYISYDTEEDSKPLEEWQKPPHRRRSAGAGVAVDRSRGTPLPSYVPPVGPNGTGQRVTPRLERLNIISSATVVGGDLMFGVKIPDCSFTIPNSGEVRFMVAAPLQPDEFYVHLADGIMTESASVYSDMSSELNAYARGAGNLRKFMSVAELNQLPVCISQKFGDDTYHRGVVEKSIKKRSVRMEEPGYEVVVFFVDLGIREAKDWDKVYQLPCQFSRLPRRSLRCRLYGVKPVGGGNWSQVSIDMFKRLCRTDVEMSATVVAEAEPLPLCVEVPLGNEYKGKRCVNHILFSERLAEAADEVVWG